MPTRGIKGKKLIVLLAVILLLSFTLMTVNVRREEGPVFLESISTWILSPIQSVLTQTTHAVADVIDHYMASVNASQENRVLQKKIDHLIKEKNGLQEQLLRLQRVNRLMGVDRTGFRKSVVASVIGRDPTQWSKVVFIDKGSGHGLRENLAVVSDIGVIGHVIQVSAVMSKVLLLIDGRSAVDSLFQGTRVSGVVAGVGEDFCDMKYVPITAEVREGDLILSSGLGGIFPKGLVIGTVSRVQKRKNELFQEIQVKPSVELARLEEVLVLLP